MLLPCALVAALLAAGHAGESRPVPSLPSRGQERVRPRVDGASDHGWGFLVCSFELRSGLILLFFFKCSVWSPVISGVLDVWQKGCQASVGLCEIIQPS